MRNLRFISMVLLIFTGLNALAGGYLLIVDPSGALLHISIEQVDPAVIDDFLLPGIFLFLFNGVLSMVAAFFVLFQWKGYPEMLLLQGILLFVWITLQLFLFEQFPYVYYLVAGTGLTLLASGIHMRQVLRNSSSGKS